MLPHLRKTVPQGNSLYNLPGVKPPFNPNFGGNALAWYDGDAGLDPATWTDEGVGGHDIVFTNSPSIIANATPLRDAVRFNGTSQYGVVATPVRNQPYTIYVVFNSITWTNNRYAIDDGAASSRVLLRCIPPTPNYEAFAGAGLNTNPDLALGTWGVYSFVVNGVNSEVRTNLNAAVTGNAGALNGNGISIGASPIGSQFWNGEIGYLIIRTGADSTAIQNYMINGLRALCGLTF